MWAVIETTRDTGRALSVRLFDSEETAHKTAIRLGLKNGENPAVVVTVLRVHQN